MPFLHPTPIKYLGVSLIPWSPLARGALTRPLSSRSKRGETDIDLQAVIGNQEASSAIINRSGLCWPPRFRVS